MRRLMGPAANPHMRETSPYPTALSMPIVLKIAFTKCTLAWSPSRLANLGTATGSETGGRPDIQEPYWDRWLSQEARRSPTQWHNCHTATEARIVISPRKPPFSLSTRRALLPDASKPFRQRVIHRFRQPHRGPNFQQPHRVPPPHPCNR